MLEINFNIKVLNIIPTMQHWVCFEIPTIRIVGYSWTCVIGGATFKTMFICHMPGGIFVMVGLKIAVPGVANLRALYNSETNS